ncbi:unnamed protein product, partial [Strongylus vulgaris]
MIHSRQQKQKDMKYEVFCLACKVANRKLTCKSEIVYLNQHPESTSLYPKLKNIDGSTVDVSCNNPGFETVAANYLKVFDDVITAVEEKPGD